MVIGERFEKDGNTYEVTGVFGDNYAYKEVKEEIPVVAKAEKEPKKTGRKKV